MIYDTFPKVLFLSSFLWMGYCVGRKNRVRIEWDVIRDIFDEWHYRNQGVYVGASPEGRALLTRLDSVYTELDEKFPWYADDRVYEYYMDLLNDLPPKSPAQMPTFKTPPWGRLFLFCIKCF